MLVRGVPVYLLKHWRVDSSDLKILSQDGARG